MARRHGDWVTQVHPCRTLLLDYVMFLRQPSRTRLLSYHGYFLYGCSFGLTSTMVGTPELIWLYRSPKTEGLVVLLGEAPWGCEDPDRPRATHEVWRYQTSESAAKHGTAF